MQDRNPKTKQLSLEFRQSEALRMNTEQYRKKIEKEILKIMEQRLIAGELDAQRAREIAKFILESLHPYMTIDEIYKAVQSFDDHFQELVAVVLPVANEHEDKIRQIVTSHVNKLIKDKKVNEANVLLKKAIDLKRT